MPDFNIRIDTQATGDGAQKSAEDLSKVTQAAGQTAPAIKDVAAETDKAEISKGKLSVAVQKLTHQFPLLGAVASALKHPIIGIAAAVAFLVREIQNQIEVQNKLAAESAADAAALTLFTFAINNARTSAVQMKSAAEEMATALAKVTAQSRDAEKAIDAETKKIDARLALDKQILDNKEKIALAELEVQRVQQGLSGEEFERRKGGIAGTFVGLRAGLERGAEGQKADVLARAHLKALEDQKNATAFELDLRQEEQQAREKLARFDRLEAEAARLRAKELEKLRAEEAQAEADVALESKPHGVVGILEFGDTGEKPLTQARMQREARLANARRKLAAAQSGQASLLGVEGERAGRRAEIAAELAGISGVRQDAISAAARAGGLAESTRAGVVSSAQGQALADEAARNTAATQRTLAELRAQAALATETLELEKQRTRLLEQNNREIRSQLKSLQGQ